MNLYIQEHKSALTENHVSFYVAGDFSLFLSKRDRRPHIDIHVNMH